MSAENAFDIDDPSCLDLFVEGRIQKEDASRQKTTAVEIASRFSRQPGVILADEVGMGKTFVALAVAAWAHFSDPQRRPVVVMVPPALSSKWPIDAAVFREKCLIGNWKNKFTFTETPIVSGVDLLHRLSHIGKEKKSIIFVTHGAFFRSMTDDWIKLAIMRRALYWKKKDVDRVKDALSKFAGDILNKQLVSSQEHWKGLLSRDPDEWVEYLNKHNLKSLATDNKNPVPGVLWDAICSEESKVDLEIIRQLLNKIPKKITDSYDTNIGKFKFQMKKAINDFWERLKGRMILKLPLLIFDEAHHLKNSETKLVKSLFLNDTEDEEAVKGTFHAVFKKMLFLTATPFQLGHDELLRVLGLFGSVSWTPRKAGAIGAEDFIEMMAELRKRLDQAQERAQRFDEMWGRLRREDLFIDGEAYANTETWFPIAESADHLLSEIGRAAVACAQEAESSMKKAEAALKPWVIRHLKPRQMVSRGKLVDRRKRIVGAGIITGGKNEMGIVVKDNARLPFLLAARTVAITRQGRAVYAEGLASSYEAFLDTRKNKRAALDEDVEVFHSEENQRSEWYAKSISEALETQYGKGGREGHPKIAATTKKVIDLWAKGEKVLVFCHYIETGKALRLSISRALSMKIRELAKENMSGLPTTKIESRLESIGKKFFVTEGEVRTRFDNTIRRYLSKHTEALAGSEKVLTESFRRFIRTPSFLVRYFDLSRGIKPEDVITAFESRNSSMMSLHNLVEDFLDFIARRCNDVERDEYIKAILKVQTGKSSECRQMKSFPARSTTGRP